MCVCACTHAHTLVTQSCLTLCDPINCSLPDSSVRGILYARILETVAISFSRGSSQPRIKPQSPELQADSLPLSHQGLLKMVKMVDFILLCVYFGAFLVAQG